MNALFDLPLWLTIVSVILVTGLTGAAVSLYLRFRFPRAAVNLQDDLLRVGHRVTPLVDVDTARFEGGATKRAGSVTIELGVDKRSLARFHLRGRRGVLLSGHERDVLAEALRRSSVAMPRNPDDPKGRFARYNFPTNVTKEEAIEIVLAPPGPGDPVPIPYG